MSKAEGPSIDRFRKRLEDQHEWPTRYMFKFIVPSEALDEVLTILPEKDYRIKNSSKGNYVSVTAEMMAKNSEEIIQVYVKANEIKGLIAL